MCVTSLQRIPAAHSTSTLGKVTAAVSAFERARSDGAPAEHLRVLLQTAMRLTPQGSDSVLTHCTKTAEMAQLFLRQVRQASPLEDCEAFGWVPVWLSATPWWGDFKDSDVAALSRYLAWHDCGKPFCLSADETGKPHFKDHAEHSARTWGLVGGSELEQELMRLDMHLHTMSAEEVFAFAKNPLSRLLLVAAIAALEANKADFGGAESTSFKIKTKKLLRRAKALLTEWGSSPR